MTHPRAYTEDEAIDAFLSYVRAIVDHWSSAKASERNKLEGVAFSILAALDGEAGLLPGFRVSPDPHPTDEAYLRSQGRCWYPKDLDIAGSLHDRLMKTL